VEGKGRSCKKGDRGGMEKLGKGGVGRRRKKNNKEKGGMRGEGDGRAEQGRGGSELGERRGVRVVGVEGGGGGMGGGREWLTRVKRGGGGTRRDK